MADPLSLSFAEIQNNLRMTLNARSKRLADDNVGSANRTILEANAAQYEEILYFFNQQLANLYLGTAEGEFLDLLAYDRYRLIRKDSKKATGYVQIAKDTRGMDDMIGDRIPIPIGTVFQTDPDPITGESAAFETTDNASILVTGTGFDGTTDESNQPTLVPIRALNPGESGNQRAGRIKNIVSSVDVDTVINPDPTSGGKDRQTDEDFRVDIIDFALTLARGTKRALRRAALLSNLVTSASVVETSAIHGKEYYFLDTFDNKVYSLVWADGMMFAGKVCVYVDDNGVAPTRSTIEKILKDIDEYRAAGTTVLLGIPDVKRLDVVLDVILEDSNEINPEETRDSIVQNVSAYFSSLGLGGRFYRNRLISAVLSIPTVKNVEIKSPTSDETDVGAGQVIRLQDLTIRQIREV